MSEMRGIRRHRDGSIDMGFYRQRAHALRRAQIARVGHVLRRGILQLVAALAARIERGRWRGAVVRPALVRRPARQK